eukprot:CAMPEP_0172195364 /NCGR_PEP_ID=MMETSP1050-20130122/26159_1 /TAXON_ID=233186 /ORGANISM="Cryptomonas curvata, Strain CCAP979/52" /LENGTH=47 /DNA_ID= /DNA_START= /DNA_END= /DNA_ORIENTATION=
MWTQMTCCPWQIVANVADLVRALRDRATRSIGHNRSQQTRDVGYRSR